jgi:hypothetical protein
MSVSQTEIETLEQWLGERLPALAAHSEKVRDLLKAANGPEKIIESSIDVVKSEGSDGQTLSEQQLGAWKALLPILAEHSLHAVRAAGPALEKDKALNKEEAAAFLGFGVRKLERHMKKRQIEYEKFGTGNTASVRFRMAELVKFRAKRSVPVRTAR